ncbi:MAG: hypothetical protein NZ561_01795 [Phycisphaerae bacterium]|nr:hypothetical protein [Phycisphaerae bacterium]MDW8261830.1 hypothetical protein [Phycisphaerales bacterium]
MARYRIPANVGKVKVAVFHGGKYAVWNGKTGRKEFRILVRTKVQAEEVARLINENRHRGWIEVLGG